jgi:hypothetical protein
MWREVIGVLMLAVAGFVGMSRMSCHISGSSLLRCA